MEKTEQQYQQQIAKCKELFLQKARDYGTSWTVLRMPSVTDQILIKVERIRTLENTRINRVGDSIFDDYMGIVNYCVIALLLWEMEAGPDPKPAYLRDFRQLGAAYDRMISMAKETLAKKNHDYGEAWRKIRVSSITDLIRMKIERLKQIEDSEAELLVSEGVDANYIDMLNYAVFALIRLDEQLLTQNS